MRTLVTWCMILGVGGLVVSDALSWEWLVSPVQMAGEAVLAQERRPAMNPVRRSRFARPVPRGWAAPSLAGARNRPDEPWRSRLAQLGLPVTAQAPRLWVEPVGDAVSSMGRDARARLGAPPLASSVGRVLADAVFATGAEVSVPTVGSLAERTCETTALPLPKVTLVKEVPEVVHKPCDRKLFGGVWYCNIVCGIGGCHPEFEVTLEREVDQNGYEIISWEEKGKEYYDHLHAYARWKVDRQWYPSKPGDFYAGGRLVAVTCNGTNSHGNAKLSVNHKEPDGGNRGKIDFSIKENGTMYIENYRVWHKDGKGYRDLRRRKKCYRTYERDP